MSCPGISIRVVAAATLGAALAASSGAVAPVTGSHVMSFHNRLVLNRLALNGYATGQIMLLVRGGRFDEAVADTVRLGGQVLRGESDVGYIRAEVPIDRLVELATQPPVEAYQIASFGRSSWQPSAYSQSRAETERNGEVVPLVRAARERQAGLSELSPDEARGTGFTADEDAGVDQWYATHPTFDGRGVTIAFLETGLVEFGHPALQIAKTLGGAEIPKIVGILNTLGPDDPDHTRVDLPVEIRARSTWHRVGNRTYILPRPGAYRFGVFTLPIARGIVQAFAVILDEDTSHVWIDSNADANFRDEQPLIDANARIDVRHLRISHPHAVKLAFVFTRGRTPHQVHFYTARSSHHTMSLSVATASATEEGLARGVAPGARALVVRYFAHQPQFHTIVEGYLETARRSDVDILCDSTGLDTVPDAESGFASTFFRRLIETYRKPIFHSAGNAGQVLGNVSAVGGVFSIGGTLGPASFGSLYGGAILPRIVVHPSSAAGPAIDGALEPEFLAPENRISAGVSIEDGYLPLPKNAPTRYLPAGYEISCCTSASSPYAAGLAALLLSAAKQTGLPYSVESLGRALRLGARFLPDWPAYKQGNGVLDVNAAWRELQNTVEVPHIVASASSAHALTPYVAHGATGPGLFDQYGWKAGQRGQRLFQLTRESGEARPIRYRVSWTGNDGTFAAPSNITLPLQVRTALPVTLHVTAAGAHSAILNLHDPITDRVVFRTQATIVAPESFDSDTRNLQFADSIPLMQSRDHFIQLPEGIHAMSIEMEVREGALSATLMPPHSLTGGYFDHVWAASNRTFTKGRYRFLWPLPVGGTWGLNLRNTSASRERDLSLVSTITASYSIVVRFLAASIQLRETAAGDIQASVTSSMGLVREPAFQVSRATMRSSEASTLATGLANLFEIDVPGGASSLRVNVRAISSGNSDLELALHDCTSGECFLWDFTLPAEREHTMVVRTPTPGRWVAAVNAAPSPTNEVRFSFNEIIATEVVPHSGVRSKAGGEIWAQTIGVARTPPVSSGGQNILLWELFDAEAARDAIAYPWENRDGVVNLADRPVAMAAAIWRLK